MIKLIARSWRYKISFFLTFLDARLSDGSHVSPHGTSQFWVLLHAPPVTHTQQQVMVVMLCHMARVWSTTLVLGSELWSELQHNSAQSTHRAQKISLKWCHPSNFHYFGCINFSSVIFKPEPHSLSNMSTLTSFSWFIKRDNSKSLLDEWILFLLDFDFLIQ